MNHEIKALAFRRAVAKVEAIKKHGISPDWNEDQIDNLVELLSEQKALESGKPAKDFYAGQQWYVEELVRFSGLTPEEQLAEEIERATPELASEQELVAKLAELQAA